MMRNLLRYDEAAGRAAWREIELPEYKDLLEAEGHTHFTPSQVSAVLSTYRSVLGGPGRPGTLPQMRVIALHTPVRAFSQGDAVAAWDVPTATPRPTPQANPDATGDCIFFFGGANCLDITKGRDDYFYAMLMGADLPRYEASKFLYFSCDGMRGLLGLIRHLGPTIRLNGGASVMDALEAKLDAVQSYLITRYEWTNPAAFPSFEDYLDSVLRYTSREIVDYEFFTKDMVHLTELDQEVMSLLLEMVDLDMLESHYRRKNPLGK